MTINTKLALDGANNLLFDASICFDNELIYDQGKFLYPHSDECADLFKDYSSWLDVYGHNADIGIQA